MNVATFRSLKAKLLAAFCVFGLIVGIGFLVPMTPPVVFEVVARIWVQPRVSSESGQGGQDMSSVYGPFMTFFNSPIITACEVMRSTFVLEEALNVLKKKLPPDKMPTLGDLKGGIRVEPVKDTDVVSVYYKSNSAFVAQEAVQAVLDAFMRLNMSQAADSAVQTRIFLESQRTLAEEQLKKIDEEIKQFQLSNGVVNLPDQVSSLITSKSTVEVQIRDAETKNKEQEARLSYIATRLGISPDEALNAEELASDPVFNSLRKQLSALEYQYADLSARYKPEHPRMRQIKAMINDLEQSSAKRMHVLFNQNGVQVKQLEAFDPIKAKLLEEMVDAKSSLMLNNVRLQVLRPMVNVIDGQLHEVPAQQLDLAELERAEKVAAERVSEIERSLNQAKLMEAVNTHTSNFQIIDRPQVSGVTIGSRIPKIAGAFLLGLFLAVATFFGLDMMDPRLRRIQAILETISLPVIGWLNHVPSPLRLKDDSLEGMHRLRLSLRSWLTQEKVQLVVASADNADGRSAIAAGLAMSFAESGARVLLIDADSYKPIQHKVFNVSPGPGLSDYLSNPEPTLWTKIIRNVGKNLQLITCGSDGARGSVLSSDSLGEMLQRARQEADIVIFDTAAASESAAALALLSPQTYLLVVARLNHTYRPDLRLLATQLRQHEFAAGALILANVDDDAVAAALTKGAQTDDEDM